MQHEAELAAVLDVAKAVASTLDLAPLLELVLEQVQRVIACTAAAVLLQEDDELRIVSYRGPTPPERVVGQTWPLSEVIVYRELLRRRAPIIVADVWDASPEAALFRGAHKIRSLGQQKERSWLWVPLLSTEQVIGLLSLGHVAPHAFTARHADLALALAQQVAVAIENARLYARSQETAALEERHRLARDLHDSVTQMLFSASLVAEVLPRLWDRDPEAARQSLDDLRLLTQGASAEMRSLLLELRPAALAEARMEELLHQLAEAMTARTRIPITVTVEDAHPLPAEVQVALYRVAQEALSNAAHHAQARHITVTLRTTPEDRELRIRDDGRGFDPAALRPGHFGLDMMRERADEVGATLGISSVPGTGTEVVVRWPDPAP
jgi:two-component system nitrate/nitrite sensor histidine kinase NarX